MLSAVFAVAMCRESNHETDVRVDAKTRNRDLDDNEVNVMEIRSSNGNGVTNEGEIRVAKNNRDGLKISKKKSVQKCCPCQRSSRPPRRNKKTKKFGRRTTTQSSVDVKS